MDTARAIAAAKLKRKVIVEMSTFTIADKEKARAVLPRPATSCSTARSAAPARRPRPRSRVLCQRRRARHQAAASRCSRCFGRKVYDVGAFGNGSKMKYVANLLVAIHNVAAPKPWCWAEGRAAAADRSSTWCGRRRQFAHLRIARADDGEGQIQGRHHEDRRLGQGHAGDRRLRQARSACRRRCLTLPSRSTSRRPRAAMARRTPPRSAPCWRRWRR